MEMTPQNVLDFWFGTPGSPERGRRRGAWFSKSDAFDQEVRSRFLLLYEEAARGKLGRWNDAPHPLLALIIVLDQFPRNMFRGNAGAFATDAQALAAAQRMVDRGWDLWLAPIERWFAYLPYQHAEDPSMQGRAVGLFGILAREPGFADLLVWAARHNAVIERFGRFPHRNAILGRASTPEEIEFLKQPGSSF